jgi:hypothetical protein
MGSCIGKNAVLKELENNFLNYNIIDKKYNIIIGTYFNTNESNKSNTMINQGICIGYNNNKINKIKFCIIHRYGNKMVELYFENDIKLIIIRENNNQIKMLLTFNGSCIEKYIDYDIIKQFKIINNNSEYIDLIHDLTNE